MEDKLKNNEERGRYEYSIEDGLYGVVSYRRMADGDYILTHTEIPEEAEGKGVASAMMKCVLQDIEAQNKKVLPQCPFAKSYIARHPEWDSLLLK